VALPRPDELPVMKMVLDLLMMHTSSGRCPA
jgi:hypothetical protein